MKVKIELTEEQQSWLLKFLNREWDEEVNYQLSGGGRDTAYLEDMLDVYEAILGKTNSIFIAIANDNDIENKKKEINEIKMEPSI